MLCLAFKKLRKRIQQATDQSVSPQSLGHLMQVLVAAICKYMEENKVTENSQHRFMKGKLHLTNVITFYRGSEGSSRCHFLWL